MIKTILIASIMLTACSHRELPHNQPLHRDDIDKVSYIINDNFNQQAQESAGNYYWVLDEAGNYVVNNNYNKKPYPS